MNKSDIQKLFIYQDGTLIWKHRDEMSNAWNGKNAGNQAGWVNAQGYRCVCVNKVDYRVSRVIWVFFNGDIPSKRFIDHIDGNRQNNRIDNLRLATNMQNGWNRTKLPSNNTTGFIGVSKPKARAHTPKPYEASIQANGVSKYLGCFYTAEEASIARDKEAMRLHGEFASMSLMN